MLGASIGEGIVVYRIASSGDTLSRTVIGRSSCRYASRSGVFFFGRCHLLLMPVVEEAVAHRHRAEHYAVALNPPLFPLFSPSPRHPSSPSFMISALSSQKYLVVVEVPFYFNMSALMGLARYDSEDDDEDGSHRKFHFMDWRPEVRPMLGLSRAGM